MKCAAVHLVLTIQKLQHQEIALLQLLYLQDLVKRHLSPPPHSYFHKQMLTLKPAPQFGAYLPNRVGLRMPPCSLWCKPPAPNFVATLGTALGSSRRQVSKSPELETPHLGCWTVKSSKMSTVRETIANAPRSAPRHRRQTRARPNRAQGCFCLSRSLQL